MSTLRLMTLATLLLPVIVLADDVDLIPGGILAEDLPPQITAATATHHRRLRLQLSGLQSDDDRYSGVTSTYLGLNAHGEIRKAHGRWNYAKTLRLVDSSESDFDCEAHCALWLRELYWSSPALSGISWSAGRNNVRQGVAYGYSPVDFFTPGLAVDESDTQPAERRNNRLGTVMLGWQRDQAGHSTQLIFSPRLDVDESGWLGAGEPYGLHLHRSNPADRLVASHSYTNARGRLIKASVLLSEDWRALGVSASQVLSDRWIGYGETALSRQIAMSDLSRLWQGGADTDTAEISVEQATLGVSYSTGLNQTIDLEYHYYSEGLSADGFRKLLQTEPLTLQNLRSESSYMGVPLVQQSLWGRFAWNELADHYAASAIVNLATDDGSFFWQLGVSRELGDQGMLQLYQTGFSGGDDSIYGSSPVSGQTTLQLSWFL